MACRRVMRMVAVGAALWLASAGSAVAAGPPPPAIAQYVETLPGAGGGTVSGYGKTHVRKLPRSVARRVDAQAGAQAPALKALATASQFGAPQSTLRTRKHAPKAKTPSAQSKQATASVPVVTSGSGNASIVVLAVVLAVLTVAMIAVGLRSR